MISHQSTHRHEFRGAACHLRRPPSTPILESKRVSRYLHRETSSNGTSGLPQLPPTVRLGGYTPGSDDFRMARYPGANHRVVLATHQSAPRLGCSPSIDRRKYRNLTETTKRIGRWPWEWSNVELPRNCAQGPVVLPLRRDSAVAIYRALMSRCCAVPGSVCHTARPELYPNRA